MKAYKGFDSQMKCRDFQFEVGKTFKHKGAVKACESGFHACEYPLDVLRYYAPAGSQFAEVEADGDISREPGNEDSKLACSILKVKASITLPGLIQAAIDYTFARSKPEGETATGDAGAASATGVRGAASATGVRGAASATGDAGAASATGVRGAASATGDAGAASATGDAGAASATGYAGKVKGAKGCALFLTERDASCNIIAVGAAIVGKTKGIKADTWYTLTDGKFVEVA